MVGCSHRWIVPHGITLLGTWICSIQVDWIGLDYYQYRLTGRYLLSTCSTKASNNVGVRFRRSRSSLCPGHI